MIMAAVRFVSCATFNEIKINYTKFIVVFCCEFAQMYANIQTLNNICSIRGIACNNYARNIPICIEHFPVSFIREDECIKCIADDVLPQRNAIKIE
uniref:Uncharacterized protein n=1 Tax=Glossina palpalis gambiensis TaxID=67801 RepID=A0A1B0BJT9_9MUSC